MLAEKDGDAIDLKGSEGLSPLIKAASKGHDHVCEYLLTQQKPNIEARCDCQYTALILATFNNHIDVVKILLDHNANTKAKDFYGYHAAYYAALKGHFEILRILVEKDPDVIDLEGGSGRTPLITASKNCHVDVCRYLVTEKKADVNLQDEDGNTALCYAALENQIDIVDLLVNNGANNLKNKFGKSPLDYARRQRYENVIKKLEDHFEIK